MDGKKRLGIFVFYDADGYVGRYVNYLLNEIMGSVNELVIVCNGCLDAAGRKCFEQYTSEIFIRDNKGYDGGAWKDAVTTFVGFKRLKAYDEVVFFNDICYGPIYPFEIVFAEMDKRSDIDFWGLTRHYQAMDFTGNHKSGVIPEHIQTYFFVVRNRLLSSVNFAMFWNDMPELKTFNDDIGLFETKFTKYFSNCGFSWDTYVNMEMFKGSGLNNYCFNYELPYVLVSEFRMPMIRRKSLTQFVPNSCAGPEKDPRRVLKYLKEQSNYDVSMIWEDLLRKNNIADLYTRLHLDYILPTDTVIRKPMSQKRIALLIHIYYQDQIEYCLRYVRNMPVYIDIYVTTVEKNEEIVRESFRSVVCNHIEIRVVKNRGRDMSALFVGCADVLESNEYDYICCIHDKKSPQVGILLGMAFRDTTFENTLASKEFVENVIGTFDREPFLGYLGFPYMIGGPYWPVLCNAWASPNNFANTNQLLERCNIKPMIAMDKPPIVYANVFWCRPDALKPLIDLHLTYEDFDEEPLAIDGTFSHAMERAVTYVAQHQGYYSGVLYTDEYASIYIPALMQEYSRMATAYANAMGAPAKATRTTAKRIIKKILRPFPHLYVFASRLWGRLHKRQ